MLDGSLSVRDIVERTGFDINRVRQLCSSGKIPATKHGREWRISAEGWREYYMRTTLKEVE